MTTIEYIEEHILRYSESLKDKKNIVRCQTCLELRKTLLDKQFINHLDEHLTELATFNERMTAALRTLWYDAHECFSLAKKMNGFDIEVSAYVELDAKEDEHGTNWFEIFCILSDSTYNPQYQDGVCISPIILRSHCEPLQESFDDFIGNDGKSWNEGLPDNLTKDIPLTMMFHHLFDHTYWALYDLVKIQNFNIILNTNFEKNTL